MAKKSEKPKTVYQSCNIKFPDRVWELTDNGWSSRPVTPYDMESRRKLADELNAVMLT